ncbi:DEKNAAC104904 [Brettanomyces naardenensis]|uniref:DEKNAAC104904 n=1 Tax=Brettanomyces naardenensis TaxID=13370 RepID=A0A448YS66_BRENA|nr:DEKNAAC104904 [Brettanomyces naardenensis]
MLLPLLSMRRSILLGAPAGRLFLRSNRIPTLAIHPRFFSISKPCSLIYQPKAKATKGKEALSLDNSQQNAKKRPASISDVEDAEKEARLLKNKYYIKTPKILRPYLKEVMIRPVGFAFSIVILQQVFVVVPFLMLWYYFFQTGYTPSGMPADVVARGLDTITRGLVNLDMDATSKAQMAAAGAASYALTKALLPVRIPVCVMLAPWFDKWCLRPITRLFTAIFKKNTVVKPRVPK